MCIYALDIVLDTCFLYSDLSMYTCLLESKCSADVLITLYVYWSLPVLACLNHITWSCTHVLVCARHFDSSYVLAGLFSNNAGHSSPYSEAQRMRGGNPFVEHWTSLRSIGSTVPHSLHVSFHRFARFPFVVSEYLSVLFMLCNHTPRLFNVIFMLCWITPYDELCTCIFLLECILPVFWFLSILMFSVYMWGCFRPAFMHRNNVSVPTGSGAYII